MSGIRTEWRDVLLGDICEFKYGKGLPASKRTPGDSPVYGSNGVVGHHSTAITAGPSVVIGRKGSVGEVHFAKTPCWPIDTTYYVDSTSATVDLRWLFYALKFSGLKELNRAAAIPGLNRDDAYRKRVLVPPPGEQVWIAEILDRADALRAKRRRALSILDDLVRAVFLEMFAPGNPHKQDVTTVAEVAAPLKGSIRTGPFGSQLLHSEFVEDGISVLGIDNVVSNEFRWSGRRHITEEKYQKLKRYTVYPGDVLISIMGTCGRCAIAPDNIHTAINTKHLCCITLNRDRCLPEYLQSYFLWHPSARSYLQRTAKGAIMPGLNMRIIEAMPLELPSRPMQSEFVRRRKEIEGAREKQRTQLAELDALFASLQDRAFRGLL